VTDEERTIAITIRYCAPCQFLGRATWVAQELLSTFQGHTATLCLEPSRGGVFDVLVDGEVVFSKHAEGRYPGLRELKEAIARYVDEGVWAPKHAPHQATDVAAGDE
jgi:selenoprotein W-related protein